MNKPVQIAAVLCFMLAGLGACAPAQPDLATPVVKGDKSTIQGDTKATGVQKVQTQ